LSSRTGPPKRCGRTGVPTTDGRRLCLSARRRDPVGTSRRYRLGRKGRRRRSGLPSLCRRCRLPDCDFRPAVRAVPDVWRKRLATLSTELRSAHGCTPREEHVIVRLVSSLSCSGLVGASIRSACRTTRSSPPVDIGRVGHSLYELTRMAMIESAPWAADLARRFWLSRVRAQGWQRLVELRDVLMGQGVPVAELDLGGGFGVSQEDGPTSHVRRRGARQDPRHCCRWPIEHIERGGRCRCPASRTY